MEAVWGTPVVGTLGAPMVDCDDSREYGFSL